MKRTLHYYAIAALIIILVPVLFIPLNSRSDPENKNCFSSMEKILESEKNYLDFIKERVAFKDIELKIIKVRKGDNFWLIARDHGIDIDTIIGTNLQMEDLLARVDQEIVVPSEKGALHFIDHFSEIGSLISEYNINKEDIEIQELPLFYRYYRTFLNNEPPVALFIRDRKPLISNMTEKLARQYEVREMFRSPLGGRFSSHFGKRKHPIFKTDSLHNGIDIATRYYTPVGAARDGTVVSAGWMSSYGKAVIIQHGEGYRTLYGHLSRRCVKPGQNVPAGRLIGRVGSTGYSTGPHLHFTIWHFNKLINPLKVLW